MLDLLSLQSYGSRSFTCGFCGTRATSPFYARTSGADIGFVRCPECDHATNIIKTNVGDEQAPAARLGRDVLHLPVDIENLYDELRTCVSQDAPTAAVITARTMLMHVAVDQGAAPGPKLNFQACVDYIENAQLLGKGGKAWLDKVRVIGNGGAHEIPAIKPEQAERVLQFIELLLITVYEAPHAATLP